MLGHRPVLTHTRALSHTYYSPDAHKQATTHTHKHTDRHPKHTQAPQTHAHKHPKHTHTDTPAQKQPSMQEQGHQGSCVALAVHTLQTENEKVCL